MNDRHRHKYISAQLCPQTHLWKASRYHYLLYKFSHATEVKQMLDIVFGGRSFVLRSRLTGQGALELEIHVSIDTPTSNHVCMARSTSPRAVDNSMTGCLYIWPIYRRRTL